MKRRWQKQGRVYWDSLDESFRDQTVVNESANKGLHPGWEEFDLPKNVGFCFFYQGEIFQTRKDATDMMKMELNCKKFK